MRDFVTGVRLIGQAAAILGRSPRLLLLGLLPAVLTALALVGLFTLAGVESYAVFSTVPPGEYGELWWLARVVTVVAGLALLAWLSVLAFTALTLVVGGPFYEYLAEKVEDRLGGAGGSATGWWRSLLRGLRDSLVLVGCSVLFGLALFAGAFVPVLGQTVIPVLAVLVGAWVLVLELVGVPFARRGLRLRQRHRALSARRGLTLGVAVPLYLLCLVPFAAVLVMPFAFVAGVLLARQVLDGGERAD